MNDTGSPREIGFAGTRHGMTSQQLAAVRRLLEENPEWVTVHLRGRFAADVQMSGILDDLGRDAVAHPSKRHPEVSIQASTILDPASTWETRRAVVDASAVLLAAPAVAGTGSRALSAMVRYAYRRGVPVTVVWPNGSTTE